MDLLQTNLGTPSPSPPTNPDNDNLPDIPIEHLEYSYVEKSTNRNELEQILLVLKSGKHGKFENLERTVEERMLSLMTPYERSKYIAMNRDPTWNEKQQASKEVFDWLNKMSTVMTPTKEDENTKNTNSTVHHHIPPVRGSQGSSSSSSPSSFSSSAPVPIVSSSSSSPSLALTDDASSSSSSSNIGTSTITSKNTNSGPKRDSKAEPFDQYYKRWENYDVEGELSKAEHELATKSTVLPSSSSSSSVPSPTIIKPSSLPPTSTATNNNPLPTQGTFASSKVISSHNQNISLPVDISTLSPADRIFSSKREKEKGNDFFRAEEYENAIKCYTRALLYDATPANATILYANRAQAHIKLKEWEHAEEDCHRSIEADSKNFKAYLRRSAARTNRGKYYEAIVDAKQVIRIAETMPTDSNGTNPSDTTNNPTHIITQAQKLIDEAQSKAKTAGIDFNVPTVGNGDDGSLSNVSNGSNRTTGGSNGGKGPRRVVIEEDDDDEEENEAPETKTKSSAVSKPLIQPIEENSAPAPVPSSTRRRVMIVEEDDDEEETNASSKETSNKPVTLPSHSTVANVPSPVPAKPTPIPTMTGSNASSSIPAPSTASPTAKNNAFAAEKAKEEGNTLFQQGKYTEAITAYNTSLSYAPNVPTVLSNRAAARLKLQQWSSAIIDCTNALDLCGLTKEIIQNTANHVLSSSSSSSSSSLPDYATLIPSALVSTAVKALFRRAQAYKEQSTTQHERLQDAMKDMASALYFEPHNSKIQMELRELRAQTKATNTTTSSNSSIPIVNAKGEASPVKRIVEVVPNPVPSSPSPSSSPAATTSTPSTPNKISATESSTVTSSPSVTKSVPVTTPTPSASSSSSTPTAVRTPSTTTTETAAVRRATPSSGTKKIPPCPRTSFELETGVTALRKDPVGMYQFCFQLTGPQLTSLFKTPADTDMLKTMLLGLRNAFQPLNRPTDASKMVPMDTTNAEWIVNYLYGLTKSIGFTTLIDMMIEGERESIETLIHLAQPFVTNNDDFVTKCTDILRLIHHQKERIEMEVIHNYDG